MLSRERPTLARRGFLRGLSALPMAAAVAVPALPAVAASTSDMEALWLSYLNARREHQAADQALRAANKQLPWWVLPGPCYLRSDGSMSGMVVGFPAIQGMEPPTETGVLRLIRPTPHTIEQDFHIRRDMVSVEKRTEWRDAALAGLRERQEAAEAEQARLGIPALDAADDAALEAMFTLEDAILALEPASPTVVAMQIMVQTRIDANSDTSISDGCEMGIAALGLRGVLPMLTGEIAATARDFLADPERRLDAMRLWQGVEPATA